MRSQKSLTLGRLFGDSFYTSDAWLEVRYKKIKASAGKCEACGRGRADGARIHVDHIKPRSKYPLLELEITNLQLEITNLQLEITNLQLLCQECNIGKGSTDETDWRANG